jgi:nuclear transport factor 2 (NTF2) superfamily protein
LNDQARQFQLRSAPKLGRTVISPEETCVRLIYHAFNARDMDALETFLTEDVHWPKGWESGHVEGRKAVRQYWLRQWNWIEPSMTPTRFRALPDDSIEVTVNQVVWDLGGSLLSNGPVTHTYTFRDGLVAAMVIGEPDDVHGG